MAKRPKKQPAVRIEKIDNIIPDHPSETGKARLHPNFEAAREATQFQPGQSGNPAGRQKGERFITEAIIRQGNEIVEGDPKNRTYFDYLIQRTFYHGFSGKVRAATELFDRAEGKTTTGQTLQPQRDRLNELIDALRNPVKREPNK